MEQHCVICKSDARIPDGRAWDRAMRAAHMLAAKESRRPDTRFTRIEVYMMMFRKIFDHEFVRNKIVERERFHYKLRAPGATLCDYCGEFDDAFCKMVMKEVEREYSISKWPNRLPRGSEGY